MAEREKGPGANSRALIVGDLNGKEMEAVSRRFHRLERGSNQEKNCMIGFPSGMVSPVFSSALCPATMKGRPEGE